MSIYRFQQPSEVQQITVRKSAGGGLRAFVFVDEGISHEQAERIQKTINDSHLCSVATEVDGRQCLEVRGLRNEQYIQDLLRGSGAIQGAASVDKSQNKKFSLPELFRSNMLTVYGIMNVVADVGLIAYGRMKRNFSETDTHLPWEDEAAGYAYSAGSLSFFALGRGDKSDYQARDIALELRKELHARGVELSPDAAAVAFSTVSERQPPAQKVYNYLSKHGGEVGNIGTGTAGALMLKGGLKNPDAKSRRNDVILGATTAISGYGAAFVKEKAPDPDSPPTTFLGKAKEWIQERPNRLAGYGYLISTGFHGYEAYDNYKNAAKNYPGNEALVKKAYGLRGGFAALNMVGEFILALASKGHGSGVQSDKSLEETALSLVADAIVRQPQAQRDGLVRDLSKNFLASSNILGGDEQDMEDKLFARVHKLERNPFLGRVNASSAVAEVTGGGQDVPAHSWVADQRGRAPLGKPEKAEAFVASVDKSRDANRQLAL